MVSTNKLSKGIVLKIDGDLYSVVEYQHHKPGKGGAVVRTKLKNLLKGTTIDKTFRADEKVEDVEIERRNSKFLYQDGDDYVFMDNQTFEQEHVPADVVGDAKDYLMEDMDVDVSIYEGNILLIDLPIFVELKVTHTEPGIKGDTVGTSFKPATLETGVNINVPLFIDIDDIIKVDTRTHKYMERLK